MEMENSQENGITVTKEDFREKRAVRWVNCPLVGREKKAALVSHSRKAPVVPDKKEDFWSVQSERKER